ncbi:hypothetical protein LX81_03049 [Palleronia aestuarii]|uniref:Transmembrane protein n=1 Tax=Palleronia aestuarii TaxID=568105 RepID=A0A2W7N2G7_9RHOB|nr:hypothetical protein [Palleronia aestuarii]PZX14250.1 hypothetical protein LX81_03049 [Palleronia aestuarii]
MTTIDPERFRPTRAFVALTLVSGFAIGVTAYLAYSHVRASGAFYGDVMRALCENEDPAHVGVFWPHDEPQEARCVTAAEAERFTTSEVR